MHIFLPLFPVFAVPLLSSSKFRTESRSRQLSRKVIETDDDDDVRDFNLSLRGMVNFDAFVILRNDPLVKQMKFINKLISECILGSLVLVCLNSL